MGKGLFRKIRSIDDRTLTNVLNAQTHGLGYHARIINHHGRVLLWLVAYAVIDALVHILGGLR